MDKGQRSVEKWGTTVDYGLISQTVMIESRSSFVL
jgi:hypothetical protein